MMRMTDNDYMKIALELALKAKGNTSPNPLVGAIIVKNNKIIAKGFHHRCGSAHAEVAALKQAGLKARGATMYVTLEPCSHFGRTPPCVDQIIKNGIKEIFVGIKDPNPLNNGKSIRKLKREGIKVKVGFCEDDLKKINEVFLKFIRYQMPFVVVKCAQTLDGKIATVTGDSKWITGKTTRDFSHKLRDDFDGILVGIETVLKDNPYLNASRKSKKIKKIIIDSKLRTPINANLFKKTNPSDVYIATTEKASKEKLNKFKKKGVHVLKYSGRSGKVDLVRFFRDLAEKEIVSILVEGGGRAIGSVLKNKLADKIWIFIAPKIIGDHNAVSAIHGLGIKNIDRVLNLQKINVQYLNEDIFLEAYINNKRKN